MNDEFQKQHRQSLVKVLNDFNSNITFKPLRVFYKQNFDLIKQWINRTSPRTAIEDIGNADENFKSLLSSNFLLVMQINAGMKEGHILNKDILE